MKQNNNNKKKKQAKRNNQRRNNNRIRRSMPAAQTTGFARRFNVTKLSATSATVSGADLVYAIPNEILTTSTVMSVIPCNPAYWTGTRIAALAQGYQNYRPLKFNVHYVPQCAVTQQGNVLAGTIWHDAPPITNLQQTLRTSNGGMMTQCYKPAVSVIRPKTNLQLNLYRMGGDIDDQSMPFFFIAISVACKDNNNNLINPGYFYVDYTFVFKNPMGQGITYNNSGLTTFNLAIDKLQKQNATAILCSELVAENFTLNIGARINIEYNSDQDAYDFNYNGTPVPAPAGDIWILSNGYSMSLTRSQMEAQTKFKILYNTEVDATATSIPIQPNAAVSFPYTDITGSNIYTVVNNSDSIKVMTTPQIDIYYKIDDIYQNFGKIVQIANSIPIYEASMARYLLKDAYLMRKQQPPRLLPFSVKDQE